MSTLTEDLPPLKTQKTSPPAASSAAQPVALNLPLRPAWIEIDAAIWRNNFQLIRSEMRAGLQMMAVIKDEAYGHGMLTAANIVIANGVNFLVVSTLEEAVKLREAGVLKRILLLGDRPENELPYCLAHNITCCVGEASTVHKLAALATGEERRIPVHLKINSGMNRYGVRWDQALPLARLIHESKSLLLEGCLTHYSQSDEKEKTFALLQLSRYNEAIDTLQKNGINPGIRHTCNSGGFLDLPDAHLDMVRIGILHLGVFPSAVCRRIPGIQPVMSVKAKIAAIQNLQPGDQVGYGMRYTASKPVRIAVLPLGYGDGFPRVRNQGCVLIHGCRAPLVGGVSMDALTVDITDIPQAALWDEAVIMGRQGGDEITVHELAAIKNSASYDVLSGWRIRLPRVVVNEA